MKIYSIIKNVWITIILFLMIYRPALVPKVSMTDILFIVSVVGYFICNNGKLTLSSFIPSKEIKLFLYIMVAAAFYASVMTFAAGGNWNFGYQYLKVVLYAFVYAAYICSFMKQNNYGMKQLVNWLLWASVAQSIFVVVMLFNNSFRTQVITQLINNGAGGITMERFITFPQRSYGLGDGYWSGMSIVSGLLANIALVYAVKYSAKYYLFIPGLLLTSAVNARTGLVIFLAGLIIVILFYSNQSIVKKSGLILLVLSVIFLIPYVLNFLQQISPSTTKWLTNISEQLNNMSEKESTADYYLLNPLYWIWPSFLSTIFGTGKSVFGIEGFNNFGHSSDSGFLGIIYRGGFVLSFLLYYATYILCFCRKIRRSQYKVLGLIFLSALIIQHYKGSVFYFNEYMTLIIILIIAIYQIGLRENIEVQRKEKILCPEPA